MKNKFKSRAFEAAVAAAIAAASAIFIFSCGNPAVDEGQTSSLARLVRRRFLKRWKRLGGQQVKKGSALLKRAKECLNKKNEELRNAALERFKLAAEKLKTAKQFDKLMTLAKFGAAGRG
jgi:hypothetical protein